MPITFQDWPWLLLLPPLAAWLVGVHRRSLADLNPLRRRVALGVRLFIATLLVAALAGATLVKWNDAQAVWFLLDRSDSISPDHQARQLEQVSRAVKSMRRGDRAGIIAFGADSLIETPLTDRIRVGKIASTPVTSYTDVGWALRLALAALPEEYARRVVLVSDGNENLGSAAEEAALAAAQHVPIDVVPVRQARGREALLERMTLPNEVKIGEPFELRLVADSEVSQDATLRLFRDNAYVGSQQVSLAPGKNVFVFAQNLERPGFHTYEARLEPQEDSLSENNRALGFALVRGRPRVLYVEGDPGQAKYLTEALRSQRIDADVANPTGIPRNLAEFQNYDSILLSNVSALFISAEQMKMIQSNVRDLGQGFGMIGGDESFGVGGYYRTPIEETLPVDMDVTKRKEWPSTAVICVIDKSGSMTEGGMGFTKVDLAKEAAIATLDVLGERDEYGVICFDEATKEVVPLQRITNRGPLRDRIASIVAGGGTSMYPAMILASEWLKKSESRVKHCILLTDGMSLPGDFQHAVHELNGVGATLSAVAIGTDADQNLLQSLAAKGGGRFYYTDDPQALPRIFTKEALLVAKSLIVEEPFLARVDPDAEVLRGIDWASRPPLLGYVATTAKNLASVPMRTSREDPLFAYWRYGLGRAFAFTSDCKARWGAGWLRWPGYQKFWGQAIRWTLRRGGRANFQTVVDIDRGRGHITVDALGEKGDFENFLQMRASVVRPDMTSQALDLRQTGPGRYEGDFDATAIGTYMANVSRADKGATASQTAGIAVSYPPEYRDLKTNDFVLTRIAERTGGRVLSDPSAVFREGRRPARVPVEIWPALLLLALLLFPLDVAVRRVMIDPAEARDWVRARVQRWRARRKQAAAPERPESLGRLLDRVAAARVERPQTTDHRPQTADGRPETQDPRPETPAGRPQTTDDRPQTADGGPETRDQRPRGADSGRAEAGKPGDGVGGVGDARARPGQARPSDGEDSGAGLSATERLLRAKRRARGDDS